MYSEQRKRTGDGGRQQQDAHAERVAARADRDSNLRIGHNQVFLAALATGGTIAQAWPDLRPAPPALGSQDRREASSECHERQPPDQRGNEGGDKDDQEQPG
jgi:hypothetical protein